MIPGEREHRFRTIVSTIPVHREHPKRLMLEQFQSRQRSWFPPKLPEETIIDASPEGLHASAQRSLALNGGGLKPAPDCRSLKLSNGVVAKYQAASRQAGLSWPLPEALDDVVLAHRLGTKPAESPCVTTSVARVIPDFAPIHEQLKQKGVTRQLLWEEYCAAHPDESYSYSQFCFHYQEWLVMRQTHRAGDKLFVDYAGPTVPIVNPITGEIREAQIFVAVLGASNYTYAEATWTQGLADWIGAHTRAFTFFDGVPALVVPDNPRSGVTKACRYEPLLNTSYQQMLAHYGTAALPARPYKARDKAKVEVAVQIVERWILARFAPPHFPLTI